MKYFIIAGEASGDLHGGNLIRGIRASDPQAEFRFWGGDRMAESGGRENLFKHYKEASFMGFWEVITHLGVILGQLRQCKRDILDFQPDVVILIDYAGFNLKIAKFAKTLGIKTFFYIAPKVWAWKEGRIKKIKAFVDQLFIIFPFEQDYFARRGIEAIYCGNPLMDSIAARTQNIPTAEAFRAENGLDSRPIIALLAGSRRNEIDYNFPFMVELAGQFPEYQFVVAGVSWLDRGIYEKYSAGSDVRFVQDQTYPLLAHSLAAVVTSGTATLETALLNVPEVVCYRSGRFSFAIARRFVKIEYVSLVNLVLGREVVRELLQDDMTLPLATAELRAILPGGAKRERMLADYAELRRVIGDSGASERVGAEMVKILHAKP
ncbi:MAG: lipid-A-disaccharide synthase [Rikenellaceae bacterium]|jgi:lipid-A-disaccharide synthase|nr:lipid-A-disaccharide synthase [Rikenellaceae bacterium]